MRSCTFFDPHRTECCTECARSIDLCNCVQPDDIAHERLTSVDGQVIRMIRDELDAARKAFPGTTHMLAALVEEAGKLSRLMIQHDREQGTSVQEVLRRAVTTATMAIRVAAEGDSNFLYQFPVVEEELPRGPVADRF